MWTSPTTHSKLTYPAVLFLCATCNIVQSHGLFALAASCLECLGLVSVLGVQHLSLVSVLRVWKMEHLGLVSVLNVDHLGFVSVLWTSLDAKNRAVNKSVVLVVQLCNIVLYCEFPSMWVTLSTHWQVMFRVNRSSESRSLLRISFPLVTDAGTYTARASLNALSDEKSIQLIINGMLQLQFCNDFVMSLMAW